MATTRLGRTGLDVSVAGLGCGGHSRLGLGQNKSYGNALAILSQAIGHGVTFIDTAQVYGTEQAVGEAVRGRREHVVISTKGQIIAPGTSALGQDYCSGAHLRQGVEDSLRRLGTDYIDIFHLHGVMPTQYQPCRDRFVPVLEDLRREGKIRFFGLTERFIHDPGHDMLQMALGDPHWDVIMVGFNMINQSARGRILPLAEQNGCGVLCMFAVRNFLSSKQAAAGLIARLIENKLLDRSLDPDTVFDFLTGPDGAQSLIEAAYRFCRHELGIDVVLTGTGNPDHLAANLAHLARPALPGAMRDRLVELFGHIDQVSGE